MAGYSQSDAPAVSGSGFARRLLREPLVHFLAIGLAVFLLYGQRTGAPAQRQDSVIVVTPAQVGRLAEQFEAVWRRPPNEAELAGLVEDHVREEVYYREALALGLDRDDTVIRRRLRAEDGVPDRSRQRPAPTAGDAELRTYLCGASANGSRRRRG